MRCIQKNVRKFVGVRDWQWWRLLVRITPMLNVHRTEDQLKSRTVSFACFFIKEKNPFFEEMKCLFLRLIVYLGKYVFCVYFSNLFGCVRVRIYLVNKNVPVFFQFICVR